MTAMGSETPGSGSPIPAARLSASRLAAVQALYQAEVAGAGLDNVILQFLEFRSDGVLDEDEAPVKPDPALFAEVVRGAHARSEEIDDMLRAALSETWPLERIELLLRCILRAAAYELLARAWVPARVVIAEYVDLADAFFDPAERGMANAVLDRLARKLRETEFTGAEGPSDAGAETAG